MPYLAPDAPMPMTSCAPRFAEIKARPVIHAGIERPERKKSVLVFIYRFSAKPIPSTKTKYTTIMVKSIPVRFFIQDLVVYRISHLPCEPAGESLRRQPIQDSAAFFRGRTIPQRL